MLKCFLKRFITLATAIGGAAALCAGAGAATLPGAAPAAPAAFTTPAALRTAIESAVAPRLATVKNARIAITVGDIDPRLHLAACPALSVSLPPTNAAMMTAKVDCATPRWTLYVPVHVHAWIAAVVAADNLAPATTLTAHDLTFGQIDIFASPAALLTDPAAAEGKILRVSLTAGSPVTAPLLELPIAVHRGQKVVLTLEDNAMTIKAMAIALEDGRVGQSITVQNPDSKKTLRATVADDGSVDIKF